jgi:hypothetical protein
MEIYFLTIENIGQMINTVIYNEEVTLIFVGDNHPLFNLTVIANLKFNTSNANIAYMYSASNIFNESYIEGDLIYDNGIVRKTLQGAGLRLKGDFTRLNFRYESSRSIVDF